MAPQLQTAVAICLFVSTFSLLYIAFESRRLRSDIVRVLARTGQLRNSQDYGNGPDSLSGPISPVVSQAHGVMGGVAGYAIFVYRKGRWELESDLSAPGYEPSAPSLPGAYESHVIKKESRPVSDS